MAKSCHFAFTDSGGLQEELTWLGKPALVLRNVTDRREAIDAGAAILVGTEPESIVKTAIQLMEDAALYRRMAQPRQLFGDGTAAKRIVDILQHNGPWLSAMGAAGGVVTPSATLPFAA